VWGVIGGGLITRKVLSLNITEERSAPQDTTMGEIRKPNTMHFHSKEICLFKLPSRMNLWLAHVAGRSKFKLLDLNAVRDNWLEELLIWVPYTII